MSRLRVDLERLERFVVHVHHVGDELARLRAEVDARVAQAHLTWSGSAATAHAELQARWAAGSAEVHEALVALHAIAATAHGNYAAAAEANRRMWAL